MRHTDFFRTAMLAVIAMLISLPALAVTDKEMEEARTITAKWYLRYANNGSGYLDEVSAKSMSELTPKLKQKEKENLQAFNSVKVPGDYASWDKDKLVEFWAVTFFTSPALSAEGKAAKSRVRSKLQAMTIAAPAPAASPEPAPEATPQETAEAAPADVPTAESAEQAQENILKDQEAIERDAEEARPVEREQSHTWVYIVVLAILVGVVIWLVVYAANLMKKQPSPEEGSSNSDEIADLKEKARQALIDKNNEIEELHRRLEKEEERNAALGAELEKLKLDHTRNLSAIEKLKEDNLKLSREERPAPRREAVETAPRTAPARRAPEPEERPVLKVIYLGRANARGIFVRADRRISAGNTIYRLDTNDGLVGTFRVVDVPEVVDLALSNPDEYLGYGATADDLNDTAGVTHINTESAGTAVFEGNYWKVLRKTRIRYE